MGDLPIRALILAAGVSRRLRGTLDDRPKCLLDFGGRTLLDRHLANLAHFGVGRVTLVGGYRLDQVRESLAAGGRAGVEVVENPDYEEGSVLSLRCGLGAVRKGESALVMDADVLYEPDVLGRLIDAGSGFCLDETSPETGEEMMLGARGGLVRTIARSVGTDWDEVGEGVGFFLCPADDLAALGLAVVGQVEHGGGSSDYEQALDRFLRDRPAPYVRVGDRRWTEIDFAEDIDRAAREILPAVEHRERLLGLA